ncbi:MAG: sensor histidine kinase [Planctomycetaceae bacterium]
MAATATTPLLGEIRRTRALLVKRAAILAALTVAAVLVNVAAPTVFFDVQIMLGASLGVFAILQFGWAGVLVGVASLAVTLVRWKHPFALLIGTGHLVWLGVFLDRFNGGRSHRDNGRIVLASIAYWLVIGLPCEILQFTRYFDLDLVKAAGLGLKECVTGVIDTSIGLVLYLGLRLWRARRGEHTVAARGIAFATVLVAVTLPGIIMTLIVSRHLRAAALESHLVRLQQAAATALQATDPEHPPLHLDGLGEGVACEVRGPDGAVRCSDPELFRRLADEFEIETANRTGVPDLKIYVPRGSLPAARAEGVSYWVTSLSAPRDGSRVTVVQPAPHLVRILDHRLLLPMFLLLFGLQAVAAGFAEGIGSLVDAQFGTVLGPVHGARDAATMPDLGDSAVTELAEMAAFVNDRSRQVNELTASLESARSREREAESRTRADLQAKLKTSLAAAAIVHEINLPLSNIVMGSNLAAAKLDELGSAGEPLRPALSGLVREAEHVVETIERMRMLLRSVQTDHGPVDVANVLHNAVTYAATELERHGVDVSVRGAEAACSVKGDAGQLQVAVVNLLRNAAEAIASSGSESRCIEVELVRHPSPDGASPELVELVVGDSGPGVVDPAAIDAPLMTTKPGGTGIGLFVVRATVENHGGALRVGRSPLGGAEFRIVLAVQA